MRVRIHHLGLLPASARRTLFEAACRSALGPAARRNGEMNLVFVRRGPMRKINKGYLGHDYDTDVISFPYPASKVPDAPFGDVFVSIDQARKQAKEMGHDLSLELLTLAVHGTLHLVGYDDAKPAQKRRMFARQDRVLRSVLRALKGSPRLVAGE